jgi:hypothetical protein
MVNQIVNQIMKTTFNVTVTLSNGKTQKISETGADIINKGGKFNGLSLTVISSASNYWGGRVDFSHDNAGNEVKDFASVNNSGASGKNKKLSQKRNAALTSAVLAELKQLPWMQVDALNVYNEVRITDTEGKTDEMPKDDKIKYPNPGQYAEFEMSVGGKIDYEYTKKPTYSNKGSFKVLGVTMKYVGRKQTKFTIDASLVFGGVEKATQMKTQPIRTMLKNLGTTLTHDKDDGVGLKHNPNALRTGSKAWQGRRSDQWQKSVGNKP